MTLEPIALLESGLVMVKLPELLQVDPRRVV